MSRGARKKRPVVVLDRANLEPGQRVIQLDVELLEYGEPTGDNTIEVFIQNEGKTKRRGELLIMIADSTVNLASNGTDDFEVMTGIAESLRDLADKVLEARDQECAR